jgi:hypothetical protein
MSKQKSNLKNIPARDQCATPWYAVDPIIRVLKNYGINPMKEKIKISEPFAGEGLLSNKLKMEGFKVFPSDIINGVDFFDIVKNPKFKNAADLVLSNPPFSKKYEIIKELYSAGISWALIVPLETLGAGKAQKMFKENGIIQIFLDKRVNYKMPQMGWESTSDFPSLWLLHLAGMEKKTITHYETINQKGVRGDEMYYKKPSAAELERIRENRKKMLLEGRDL